MAARTLRADGDAHLSSYAGVREQGSSSIIIVTAMFRFFLYVTIVLRSWFGSAPLLLLPWYLGSRSAALLQSPVYSGPADSPGGDVCLVASSLSRHHEYGHSPMFRLNRWMSTFSFLSWQDASIHCINVSLEV